MSGSAAKAKTREIRRAFGPEAVSVIRDHTQAIALLNSAIAGVQRDVVLAERVNRAATNGLVDDTVSLRADVNGLLRFRTRGFKDRLRWVFFGR